MRKAAFRACLVCLCILLPFSFSFIASAASMYPIPPNYNYRWGRVYNWDSLTYTSAFESTSGTISMSTSDMAIWGDIYSDTLPPAVERFQFWAGANDPGVYSLVVDFEKNGSYIFPLANNGGYSQFWFPFMCRAETEDGQFVKPVVTFRFFGEKSDDFGYILATPSYYFPVTQSSTLFKNAWFCPGIGVTFTQSVLDGSSYVTRVVVQINCGDVQVDDIDLWLGSICCNNYTNAGVSEEAPVDGVDPPALGENDQEITDIEGSIQNSTTNINNNTNAGFDRLEGSINDVNGRIDGLNSDINGLNSDINSGFDDVNGRIDGLNSDINGLNSDINSGFDDVNSNIDDVGQSINNRIDDMVNDDMGYEKPDNPDIDDGLSDGDSLLGSLNDSLDNFSEDLSNSENFFEESFGGSGLTNLSYFLDGIYGSIPVALVSCITAVVIFLVIRKVVGR